MLPCFGVLSSQAGAQTLPREHITTTVEQHDTDHQPAGVWEISDPSVYEQATKKDELVYPLLVIPEATSGVPTL